MKTKQNLFAISIVLLVTLLAGGCIRPEGATQGATTGTTTTTMTNTETVSTTATVTTTAPVSETTAMTETGGAMATVSTTSLRVRTEPNATSQQVASAKQGETYKVIGLSSDGQWVELAIDKAPGGKGWVSANFVTVMGSITDVPITQVGATQAVTETTTTTETTATETPTATVTETATTTEATPTQAVTETATTTATTEATATPAMTETATTTATTAMTATAAVSVTIPTPDPGMAVVNTAVRLRVRGEPNADAQIVGYAYPGETYEVLGKSDDGLWVHIAGSTAGKGENPNGGWVSANFVIIGQ